MTFLDALAKRAGFAMTREAAARGMCCVRCALPSAQGERVEIA